MEVCWFCHAFAQLKYLGHPIKSESACLQCNINFAADTSAEMKLIISYSDRCISANSVDPDYRAVWSGSTLLVFVISSASVLTHYHKYILILGLSDL